MELIKKRLMELLQTLRAWQLTFA